MKRHVIVIYMTLFLATVSGKAAGRFHQCLATPLKNGVMTVWPSGSGRKAAFKCNKGYELFGAAYSDCTASGWDSPLPVCVSAGCDAITHVRNGNIDQESNNGAVVQFTCNPGYYSPDFPVAYCNGTQWNSTHVECKADYGTSQTRCDFEPGDLCGWTQRDLNGSYTWRLHSGSTPSRIVGTGPLFDHTLGPGQQGHYMYIEASTGKMGDTALLYSPAYSNSLYRNACVYFWYHMYGATTGSLKVYVKPEEVQLDQLKSMFEKDGHQEDAWLLGFFHLNESDKPFQIVFEGVHGHGYTSDIAVDDVKLVNGPCSAQDKPKYSKKGRRRSAEAAGRAWQAGAVAAAALVGGVLLAAAVVLLHRRRRRRLGAGGGKWEAAPNDAYVRYMSHEEALVQEDSDASDGPPPVL